MLEPHSRRLLMDSLHPPEGHRLHFAIGTTYSLDLTALLTAPVAFAFSDWDGGDGDSGPEPVAMLKAVREYADRICLFCQAGRISVPRAYRSLFASLEGSVVEAEAPRGGSFHPKVWFLRYVPVEEPSPEESSRAFYRFLCLSRNLTFDRSWDTVLCLEGALKNRSNAFAVNRPLGEFVEALAGMAVRPLSPPWPSRLEQMAHEVCRVAFEVPPPFESLSFHPLGRSGWSANFTFDRMDRLLVVSPFLDEPYFAELLANGVTPEVVSRPESLDLLPVAVRDRFSGAWVLDDSADPEPEDPASATAAPGADSDAPAALPLSGLHAKLHVVDDGRNASVLTGSANATRAAFSDNVEFLVRLNGRRKDCGIEAVFGEEASGAVPSSLRSLCRRYTPPPVPREGDDKQAAFERGADWLARQLAKACPEAVCAALPGQESYSLSVAGTREHEITLPPGFHLKAWPVSLNRAAAAPVDPTGAPWVTFPTATFEALTAFVAFEVTADGVPYQSSFVLHTPLRGAPSDRRERLLHLMLKDRDRLLQFLLLLLAKPGTRHFSDVLDSESGAAGDGNPAHGLLGSGLFEVLLQALHHNPGRLDEIDRLLKDLRQTPEGRNLLPPSLDAVWEPIWQVCKKLASPGKRR